MVQRRMPPAAGSRVTVKPAWLMHGLVIAGLAGLSACSPRLDWREVRPEGTTLIAQLPCKPSRHARQIELAGQRADMNLMSCQAGDATWAVAWVEQADVRSISPMLEAWRAASVRNVAAERTQALPLSVPGATPQPSAGHWRSVGKRPDGTAVTQEVALFSHGVQVFQATVLTGNSSLPEASVFFAGLRFKP